MVSERLRPFQTTLQKADDWMRFMMRELGTDNPQEAYHAMKAALHTLRDRLIPNECAHLAAQLPMLIRGLYFEGWDPDKTPTDVDTEEEFLQEISLRLQPGPPIDPHEAARAVFHLLQANVTAGEIKDVRDMLPKQLEKLWAA